LVGEKKQIPTESYDAAPIDRRFYANFTRASRAIVAVDRRV
jgi:hypothetical protein